MLNQLIFIIPWILALVIAYFFIGTLGNKLKKEDLTTYELLKKDANKIQEIINTETTNRKALEKQKEDIENDVDEEGNPVALDTAKLELKAKTQEAIDKSQKKINFYEVIKVKGLDSWDWSFSNISWVVGIFLISGVILHWITKWLCSWIFKNNKE